MKRNSLACNECYLAIIGAIKPDTHIANALALATANGVSIFATGKATSTVAIKCPICGNLYPTIMFDIVLADEEATPNV